MLKRACSVSVMAHVSEMACVSACGELKRGRFQTRDGIGEPFAPYRVIVEIAPVSRDVANEACSAFSERSSRARLRGGIPVREHPAFRERPSHGRLKWRRGLGEFGTRRFPRGRVFGASRAAYRVFCARSARSRFPGRYARASCRLGARVTSSAGISRHKCRRNGARCSVWGTPRKRALGEIPRVTSLPHESALGRDVGIARKDERACRKPPPWRCREGGKASLPVHEPRQGVGNPLAQGTGSTS